MEAKRGRESGKAPRHVRLYHWVMDTAAWQGLSGLDRAIYLELSRRYNGSNNGRISYSIREASSAMTIGKSTAHRSLRTLVDHGFIVCMKKGAFSLKTKHATEWRLTEFACDVTNSPASKDFLRWAPLA